LHLSWLEIRQMEGKFELKDERRSIRMK
jgi:hypothetical protein